MSKSVPQWNHLPQNTQKDLANWRNWYISHRINERLTLLNVYSKLKRKNLWQFVKGPSSVPTSKGKFEFVVTNVNDFKRNLRNRKDFDSPETSSQEWDSRERLIYAPLHFKHVKGWGHATNEVQAHIDPFGIGAPLLHWKTQEGYKDVHGIRNMLVSQGYDRSVLYGVPSSRARRVIHIPPILIKGKKPPFHIVSKGETLSHIARTHRTTVNKLAKLNPWLYGRHGRKLQGVDYILPGERIRLHGVTRNRRHGRGISPHTIKSSSIYGDQVKLSDLNLQKMFRKPYGRRPTTSLISVNEPFMSTVDRLKGIEKRAIEQRRINKLLNRFERSIPNRSRPYQPINPLRQMGRGLINPNRARPMQVPRPMHMRPMFR